MPALPDRILTVLARPEWRQDPPGSGVIAEVLGERRRDVMAALKALAADGKVTNAGGNPYTGTAGFVLADPDDTHLSPALVKGHPTSVNTDRNLTLLDTTDPTAEPPTGWRRGVATAAQAVTDAVDQGVLWLQANRSVLWLRENWPLLVIAAIGFALVAGVLRLIWLLLTAIGHGLAAARDGLTSFGRWLADGPITHTITDPVRGWLDAHSAGLPATGGQLAVLWAVVAGLLWLAALLGSRYARIGWAAVGAATTAAVYAGSPATGAAAAAAITGAVWLLLSLPAYASRTPGPLTRALADLADDLHRRREAAAGRPAGSATTDTTV